MHKLTDPMKFAVDAKLRSKQEGDRGISWTFMHMEQCCRDAFDRMLVQAKHPLAYQPGTQEWRFAQYVRTTDFGV